MAIPTGTPCNQWLTSSQIPPPIGVSPWPTPIYAATMDSGGAGLLLFYFDPHIQAWYWEIPGAPPGTNTLSAAQKAIIIGKLGAAPVPTSPNGVVYFDCAAVGGGAFPWPAALAIGVGVAALAWVAARRQA